VTSDEASKMSALKQIALAAALSAAVGCGSEGNTRTPGPDAGTDAPVTPRPDAGVPDKPQTPDAMVPTPDSAAFTPDTIPSNLDAMPSAVKLVDLVRDLVTNHTNATSVPVTIHDKDIEDTNDPTAFDSLLAR
jgi:hypothetical protein